MKRREEKKTKEPGKKIDEIKDVEQLKQEWKMNPCVDC